MFSVRRLREILSIICFDVQKILSRTLDRLYQKTLTPGTINRFSSYEPMKRVRTISLFSGCGGSDLALTQLGFDVVWANDLWSVACSTYKDNIPQSRIECGDIADFAQFPAAELLVGCYPCQGFTQGGRRDWGESLNFLYREFDRVLRSVKPDAFVVENVNGMAFGDSRRLLANQLCRYRLAGYRLVWKILDAADYGVPQTRRRVFLVGVRSDLSFKYHFPEPSHRTIGGQPAASQRAALAGMPNWPVGEFNEEPFHWYYLSRNRRRDWSEPSPCIVGHWRHVPLHPSSPPLRRIHTDKWEFTSSAPARRLAYRECAALQGFPREFVWNRGSVRDRFQMIGNAVPPPLYRSVVRNLQPLWS